MFRAEIILENNLDVTIEGKTTTIVGYVTSLPETRDKKISFEFYVTEIVTEDGVSLPSPGKVRLSWYNQYKSVVPGQYWHLKARLKRPFGFMNPGGFDYEAWLFQKRIRATGYVINSINDNFLLDDTYFTVNKYRYLLREELNNVRKYDPYHGLIIALSLGDRSQINNLHRDILQNTGTNHLLAISGLHIGIIAGFIYLIAFRLYCFAGFLHNILSASQVAAITSMFIALIYAAMAGFSIPTQRALIMLLVVMLSIIMQRKISFSGIFFIALLVILLIDPFSINSIGFWLSFCAVMIIAYGMFYRKNTGNIWWRWGRVQYVVSLGLLPVLIFFFHQYPLISLAANMFAVPWVSIFILPFILLATVSTGILPGFSIFIFSIASLALDILFRILEWLTVMVPDFLKLSNENIYCLLIGMVGVALLLQPRGLPGRFIGFVWMLPLFLPFKERAEHGEFIFTLLDVGQGLSAVIETRNHLLVYDTGAKFNENFNAGSSVIIPFLRKHQIDNIDLLIISHGDNDHTGGFKPILQEFQNIPILTSVPEKFKQHDAQYCTAGQNWKWDGVNFEILHPGKSFRGKGNNSSCVLRISNDQHAILVSGDIEKAGEKILLNNNAGNMTATILVAPHHGSKSSSTTAFIDEISPDFAFFPAGYRNRYNFPNQDIIARYESRGISLLDTAQHGAIIVKSGAHEMEITSYRQKAQRYWHTRYNN